jgi:hypothetical protein
MSTPNSSQPVLELRVAFTTQDYERLVKFLHGWPGPRTGAVMDQRRWAGLNPGYGPRHARAV